MGGAHGVTQIHIADTTHTLEPGLHVLQGPNGCGKTSLLRSLAGLARRPGMPYATAAPRAAFATQRARDGLVGLTVAGECRLRRVPIPPPLAPLADRPITQLSAGEARRVALELCLASDATILLFDEPLDGLDAAQTHHYVRAIQSAAHNRTVIVADHTHTFDAVADHTIPLGHAETTTWGPYPAGEATALSCAPASIRIGEQSIATPGLELPNGVHVLRGGNGSGKSTLLAALATGDHPAVSTPANWQPGTTSRYLSERPWDLLGEDTVADCIPGELPQSLAPLAPRHPLNLSGGEAQRAALARVFAEPAPILLLDEPEIHLDATGRQMLDAWLKQAAPTTCILIATHDPGLTAAAATIVEVQN